MKILLKGFDEFDKKLQLLGNVGVWALPIMDRAVKYVYSQVPAYPSPPSGSSYRRTNTLGRSITTEAASLTGNDVVASIGTATVYAPWVISSKKVGSRGPQAWMHQDRWWTLQDVVAKQADKVRQIFEAGIRALLK